MTIIRHELRQGRKAFIIWTASIAFLMAVCIFMFPEMKTEMDSVSSMFSSMGSFTAAFGMDRLNFGTLTGFYAIECGNILGLGGAFFASMIGIAMLAKEEKDGTAEFLFTHPLTRTRIITEKLAAAVIEILAMNVILWGLALACVAVVGEPMPFQELTLLHLAYTFMQLELFGICFGISAFIRRGGLGAGLGLAAMMYFLNLIGNISDSAAFVKYITPFSYAEGADIVTNVSLDMPLVLLGALYTVLCVAAAYIGYGRKDIR